MVCLFLLKQVGEVDHIELSSGPEFETALASKAVSISKEGLWSCGPKAWLSLKEKALLFGVPSLEIIFRKRLKLLAPLFLIKFGFFLLFCFCLFVGEQGDWNQIQDFTRANCTLSPALRIIFVIMRLVPTVRPF